MADDKSSKPKNTDVKKDDDDDDDPCSSLMDLRTGDLLLYRTRDLGAAFNSYFGGSFYSHVSLVVNADPAVLEEMYSDDYKRSDPQQTGIAIFEAEPKRGVAVFPLLARLARTIRSVKHLHVRRHAGDITDQHQNNLLAFMNKVLGRNLETVSFNIFRAVVFNRCNRCRLSKQREKDWDEFFCSELVAEGLMQLGVIRSDAEVKSNLLIPSSFQDPRDQRQMRHSGAFDFLDEKICLPGHDYGLSEVLIEPGNAMETALRRKKQEMLEEKRNRSQKFRESIARFRESIRIRGKPTPPTEQERQA